MSIDRRPIFENFAPGDSEPIGVRIGEVVRGYRLDGRDPDTGSYPSDSVAEARNLLQNLKRSIEGCGGTLAHVAQVTFRFTDVAQGMSSVNPVWTETFPDPDDRPTYKFMPGNFAVGRTMDAAYFAILSPGRRSVHIAGVDHTNPIPMAVRIGDYLFSSRVLPIDPLTGREVRPSQAQGTQVFANVQAVLEAAQMRWQDVTQGRVFLQDMTLAPALKEMWAERVSATSPKAPLHIQPYVTVPNLQVMLEIIAHTRTDR